MAHQRGFRNQRSSRQAVSWGFGPGGTGVTQVSTSSKVQLGSSLVLSTGTLKTTIRRTRGLFTALLSSVTSAADGYQGAVGIAKVSEQSIGIGIGSVPSPLTNMDWDGWLWHSFVSIHANEGGDRTEVFQIDIDSKAMRKFGAEESLVGVLDVVEIGTAALEVFFDTRMLFGLH